VIITEKYKNIKAKKNQKKIMMKFLEQSVLEEVRKSNVIKKKKIVVLRRTI